MLKKVVDTDAEDIDDSSMVEQATRLDSFLEVKNGAKNGVLRGQSQQEKRRLTRARKRGRGRRGGKVSAAYAAALAASNLQSVLSAGCPSCGEDPPTGEVTKAANVNPNGGGGRRGNPAPRWKAGLGQYRL